MIYAVLSVLFVAQAIYSRFLFNRFREKVYLDVMDFIIERRKKEALPDGLEGPVGRPNLKLVKNNR